MTIKEMIQKTNMSMRDFARYFDIPYRTIQSWLGGTKPPDYLVSLMDYKLQNEKMYQEAICPLGNSAYAYGLYVKVCDYCKKHEATFAVLDDKYTITKDDKMETFKTKKELLDFLKIN